MRRLFALACTAFIGFAASNGAQAAVITTTADTSVYTSNGSAQTFNQSGYAGSAGDGEVARDYLEFVIPVVANSYVSAATLLIHYGSAYNGASSPLAVFATTAGWNAGTLTWANQPGLGSTIASFDPLTNGITLSIDVTSAINSQYLTTGIESLVIAGAQESFTSGGANSWRYLSGGSETLSYTLAATHVPEPASMALLGTGLIGLRLFRRNRAA